MMLQECYKIQCIQVVVISCEEIATLLMDYDANHHPVVRPHEGLNIGGDPYSSMIHWFGLRCRAMCPGVSSCGEKFFFF